MAGHPSWFFAAYLVIVFFSTFLQVVSACLFVLRAMLKCTVGVALDVWREVQSKSRDGSSGGLGYASYGASAVPSPTHNSAVYVTNHADATAYGTGDRPGVPISASLSTFDRISSAVALDRDVAPAFPESAVAGTAVGVGHPASGIRAHFGPPSTHASREPSVATGLGPVPGMIPTGGSNSNLRPGAAHVGAGAAAGTVSATSGDGLRIGLGAQSPMLDSATASPRWAPGQPKDGGTGYQLRGHGKILRAPSGSSVMRQHSMPPASALAAAGGSGSGYSAASHGPGGLGSATPVGVYSPVLLAQAAAAPSGLSLVHARVDSGQADRPELAPATALPGAGPVTVQSRAPTATNRGHSESDDE